MNDTGFTASLEEKYKKLRVFSAIMLLLLLCALASIFFNRSFALMLLGAALAYHFLLLRRKQKDYSNEVTKANLLATIAPSIGAKELHPDDGGAITTQTLLNSSLMPVKILKGSPLLCWGMDGAKDGFSLSMCDATIAQDFGLKEKGKKRIHFNAGIWVHIELPDAIDQHFCLLDEASVPTPIRMDYFSNKTDMQTASVGNKNIGSRCVLYRPKEKEKQLSAKLLHEIQQLLEYTPGYLAISAKDTSVDFFLRGRFLSRPVSIAKAPTKQMIEFDPFPELAYIIKITKAMYS